MRRHLVIMARAPVMGRVKSRLARDIGPVAATAFYRCNLARLMRELGRDQRWRTVVAVTPDRARRERAWPRGVGVMAQGRSVIAQGRGDLGARMGRIMRRLPPGPAVIIGTDIPELCAADIAEAFRRLGRAEAVLGPSPDGGYYLVGLKRVPRVPDAFSAVRWSGEFALADTLANLEGHAVELLRPLADIDTGDDYARWLSRR